jgi:hypothetical protein
MRWLTGLLLVLALSGCGLAPEVVAEIEHGQRGARAIMEDESLDPRGRKVGEACYDFSWAVLYSTGEVDQLPADVRARIELRRVARERENPR